MALKIGNLKLSNPLILAPMHGVNCTAFRILCHQQGAALVTTPMIHSLSFMYTREIRETRFTRKERPLAAQIIGPDPQSVKETITALEPHADIIDLNFGCPDQQIVKQKMGAYFSKHPDKAGKIIIAATSATNKPVTIKIRTGWGNDQSYLKLAKTAEDMGAAAITLHARTKQQGHSGEADWSNIKKLKQKANIPIIGNGGIWTAQDARRMLQETGCDFAMIARGAIGNPHIFKQSAELIQNNKTIPELTDEKKKQQLIKFIDLYTKHETNPSLQELKKQAMWFCKGMNNAAGKRRSISSVRTEEELINLIKEW